MSIFASIDISIASRLGYSITSIDIINTLINNGWKIRNENKIYYLPIGDNDNFDWQDNEISEKEFFSIAKQKDQNNEIIGVALIWKDSKIGGTLLIYPEHKFSINLTINLKKLNNNIKCRITDVNWYLEKILPFFENDTTTVENFSFIQC